jgi:FkbM family methyltransferase
VGANIGEWTADFLNFCMPRRMICVEPEPSLAAGLRQRFADDPRVEVRQTAVGEKAGTAEFKLMQNSVLNSLRAPAASMQAIHPEPFQVKKVIKVEVNPLDAIAPAEGRITLLKIDTQGFEREVLAGATRTLQRTDYVMLEVNFQPHYEGEAAFFELDGIMRSHGFCIGNYSKPQGGRRQALFADMLYLRKDS